MHSVEKYTKTLSRWKNFRQTKTQNYANFTFTNAYFSTFWGQIWVKWTKLILKNSTCSDSKESFLD